MATRRDGGPVQAELQLVPPSAAPRTWLLRVGWRVHGAIVPTEVPGPGPRVRAAR